MTSIDPLLRLVIFAAFVVAAVVAITHWAVREGKLAPFGWWPQFVRRSSDPLLRPIERRILRAGGNPQQAPLWLAGLVVVGGLLLITMVRWLAGVVDSMSALSAAGPAAWISAVLHLGFTVLRLALIVRVIASWFGRFEHHRWMRPFYLLTEWMLRPLRNVVPRMGIIDIAPLVAYLILIVAERLILGLLM